jgi:hypothetical protein
MGDAALDVIHIKALVQIDGGCKRFHDLSGFFRKSTFPEFFRHAYFLLITSLEPISKMRLSAQGSVAGRLKMLTY